MNKLISVVFIVILSIPLGFTQPDSVKFISKMNRFNKGEELFFRFRYGWFTVGRANLHIEPKEYLLDDKKCFKVDVSGKTAGLLGVFTHIDDSWGAYVSMDNLLPIKSYCDLEEGKYIRQEDIYYDQENKHITVNVKKKKKPRHTKYFDSFTQVHDFLSGYLHVRNIDFHTMNVGDTTWFNVFYDQIFYRIGIIYMGKEVVKTAVGKRKAHKVATVVPKNKIFPGDNPIIAWISDDYSQLLLHIEAQMNFGKAHVELTGYKNVKNISDHY